MKIKVGDIVKCIDAGTDMPITKGKTYIVQVNDWFDIANGMIQVVDDNNRAQSFRQSRFELSTEDEKVLQDLLDLANKGRAALVKLHELAPTRLVHKFDKAERWTKYQSPPKQGSYSLVPKNHFKDFKFGPWKASSQNDTFVSVGCQVFKADHLAKMFLSLLNGADYSTIHPKDENAGAITVTANRNGIKALDNNISWGEVENFYAKIK